MDASAIIGSVVGSVVVTAVVTLAARTSRRTPEIAGDSFVMRYPRWFRNTLVCCGLLLLLLVGSSVLLLVLGGDIEPRLVIMSSVILGPLAVYGLLEPRVWVDISDRGIRAQTAFRGMVDMAWEDVLDVKWSAMSSWYVIRGKNGDKIRVSGYLQGMAQFDRALTGHLDERRYQSAQRDHRRSG